MDNSWKAVAFNTLNQVNKLNQDSKLSVYNKSNVDTVALAYKTHLNPYFNQMELNGKGFLRMSKKTGQEILSRNDAPTVFQLAGCFLVSKKSFLKYEKVNMPNAIPYVVSQKKGLMIDTNFEFEIASKL